MTGPPRHLSHAQTTAIRAALREWDKEQKEQAEKHGTRWNQTKLGEALGVTQQIAGGYLGAGVVGISMPIAIRIATLLGYASLDEFFEAKGVSDPETPSLSTQGNRDIARRLARQAGVSDVAITRVLNLYDDTFYNNRPTKWWLGKFIDEDKDVSPLALLPTPIPRSATRVKDSESTATTKKKGRKKS